jgi:hypothetical protein
MTEQIKPKAVGHKPPTLEQLRNRVPVCTSNNKTSVKIEMRRILATSKGWL